MPWFSSSHCFAYELSLSSSLSFGHRSLFMVLGSWFMVQRCVCGLDKGICWFIISWPGTWSSINVDGPGRARSPLGQHHHHQLETHKLRSSAAEAGTSSSCCMCPPKTTHCTSFQLSHSNLPQSCRDTSCKRKQPERNASHTWFMPRVALCCHINHTPRAP